MPTYEYACRECGSHLEVVQSFRDDSLTTCPSCSGPLRKVFGAAGIIFKGSGYYVNDSRKSKDDSASSKKSEGASAGGGDGGGNTAKESTSSKEKKKDGSGSSSSDSSSSSTSTDTAKSA